MSAKHQGLRVTPGDEIAVEEEYFSGPGTYIDVQGIIRSQLVGYTRVDIINRILSVKHVKGKPIIPKQGDIVIGVVDSVSNDIAVIRIYSVENTPSRSTEFTGLIHVSQVSREYIESLYDAMRIGDLVRARVLNNRNPYQLTTREPGLGVIAAFCTKCGGLLRKNDDRLICPVCGNVEKRKISTFYLYRG